MTNPRKTLKNLKPNQPVRAKKPSPKKKKNRGFSIGKHFVLPVLLLAFLFALWHYKYTLYYFFKERSHKRYEVSLTNEMRIFDVLQKNKGLLYGIDVSHYQGNIDWDKPLKIQDSFPVSFVFVRATAGKNLKDRKFDDFWKALEKRKIIRGAYHYYRPNENSLQQAQNFIKTVRLKKGDLPPVLDIENVPSTQSLDSLKLGLRRWLNAVENHYGMKPIIYSGDDFYGRHLYESFPEYKVWIANYNFFVERAERDWHFWQFTDKASIPGCNEPVDANIFNGDSLKIAELLKK